jgi:hypothetical protein
MIIASVLSSYATVIVALFMLMMILVMPSIVERML